MGSGIARPAFVVAGVVGLTLAVGGWFPPSARAVPGLWNAVSRAPAEEAARERRQAQTELAPTVAPAGRARGGQGGDASARSEAHLRRALQISPGDFEARRQLGELFAATGRPREAAREFEAARRVAPGPVDEARTWFRLANERTRMGAYDEALDAYDRELALGDLDPTALSNSAELLMATGRLPEAIERYREALAIDERDRDRRSRIQTIALGYFGLAVALDRDGRQPAAREAIGRALALDAGLAVLRLAQGDGGDLFLVPPGDASYYVGLAREGQGRWDEAAAAFRDYLRVPTVRYARRAREHLADPAGDAGLRAGAGAGGRRSPASAPQSTASSGAGRAVKLRVIHEATLSAEGPLVAPLIDAAWRLDGRLLDDCLSEVSLTPEMARATREFRLSLELTIEETGRVSAAKVRASVDLGPTLPSCIEDAVRSRLRVSRPTRKKPTRARIELVLAPAEPSGV